MTIEEAKETYKKMLPVRVTEGYNYCGRIYDMILGLCYRRNGALFTEVFAELPEGERAISVIPIKKLEVVKREEEII